MYDYGLSVMEQYGLTVKNSYRGRGALICQTGEGICILRPFEGSVKRLEKQQKFLNTIDGDIHVDSVIPTLEGSLISADQQERTYVLRKWYEGRECDTRSQEDILESVSLLAGLHSRLSMEPEEEYVEESLESEYYRHNCQLRKIRKFIRKKKVSNAFERELLKSMEEFIPWGEEALALVSSSHYKNLREKTRLQGCICHGEFNQHHVILGKNQEAVTGFDRWKFGIQAGDLYCFMRKILEKWEWDPIIGRKMLERYNKEKILTREELEYLRIRFSYPEKYWKLANYYFSHNKAWISEKNMEKLQVLIHQKKKWREFIRICFDITD